MDITRLIDQYAAYDLWANTRVIDRLSREPESLLDVPVKSSFPSLRSTLMHIRDAECTWRARMAGEPPRWPAEPGNELPTFLKHVSAMRDYVRTLGPAALIEVVTYKDLRGNEHRQPRLHLLMHCFNHSSYHRGQIVTMMRQLDLTEIPALDLVVYQRMNLQG